MKKSSILFLSAFVLLAGCTPNHKSSEESKTPLTLDETFILIYLSLQLTKRFKALRVARPFIKAMKKFMAIRQNIVTSSTIQPFQEILIRAW